MRIVSYLRQHVLVWLIPLICLTALIGYIAWLAHAESTTPDSPFIYDF